MPDWTSHTGGHHPGFPGMVGPGRPMHGHPHLMQQQVHNILLALRTHDADAADDDSSRLRHEGGKLSRLYRYTNVMSTIMVADVMMCDR